MVKLDINQNSTISDILRKQMHPKKTIYFELFHFIKTDFFFRFGRFVTNLEK